MVTASTGQGRRYHPGVVKKEPCQPEAHYEFALVYRDMGKKDKALEYLNTALRVWEEADAEFKPAIKARDELAAWGKADRFV